MPPVPYPPCVLAQHAENCVISECCFLNAYEAIKLVHAARHLVRNVTGYPSQRGIFVDECYDIGHIENIHFWPFGVAYTPGRSLLQVDQHTRASPSNWHGPTGTTWHNTFCFGYGVGYKFSQSKAGSNERQLPRSGRRFLPLARSWSNKPKPLPADHQRRICGPLGQHRFRVPGDRPRDAWQGEPRELLILGPHRSLRVDDQSPSDNSPPAPAISRIGTIMPKARPPSSSMPAGPSCRAAPSDATNVTCW